MNNNNKQNLYEIYNNRLKHLKKFGFSGSLV